MGMVGDEAPGSYFVSTAIVTDNSSVESYNGFNSSGLSADSSGWSTGKEQTHRSRFDDRAVTKISKLLREHGSEEIDKGGPKEAIKEHAEHLRRNSLRWIHTGSIGKQINSTKFHENFGCVTCIEPSGTYMAFGTSRGYVVCFNYHQSIDRVLEHKMPDTLAEEVVENAITCMAFSPDMSYLAAGYQNGRIIVWDLQNHEATKQHYPFYVIEPITIEERFTQRSQAHLKDVSICFLAFLNTHGLQFVSADSSGLVFYHNGFKKFMHKYITSQKILGTNDANNIADDKYRIYGCEILPIGSAQQITDSLGVTAVITSKTLVIASVLSLDSTQNVNLRVHYKAARSKSGNHRTGKACLNWFPCMQTDNKRIENARLAFAWEDTISIIELNNKSFPKNMMKVIDDLKEKDKALPILPFKQTCSMTLPESQPVLLVKWLSRNILFTISKRDNQEAADITLLNYKSNNNEHSLSILLKDTLDTFPIVHQTLSVAQRNHANVESTVFDHSVKSFKERVFFLAGKENKFEILFARMVNWADKLIEILARKQYSDALYLVYDFFTTKNPEVIVLVSLPETQAARAQLIKPYLIRIMKESTPEVFDGDENSIKNHLVIFLSIYCLLYREDDSQELAKFILDSAYESIPDKALFFSTLEPLILDKKILVLTPAVLKGLVEYYIEQGRGDTFTEIICILDIGSLDIDLTILLCRKHNLRDPTILVHNLIFRDYLSPLYDFVNEIISGTSTHEAREVFTYLTYILTGRQYPTDRFIDEENSYDVKKSVATFLFSSAVISSSDCDVEVPEKYEDTIFPYLHILLRFDSLEMLSTLNEFFEDPFLNEESENTLSRQYIIEALLDVFELNKDDFTALDRCQLAIFVSRNYPKYPQFIRLSDSVLDIIVDDLCSNSENELNYDCELGIQSILQIYEPSDITYLIHRLKACEYYRVLIGIYRSAGQSSKMLEVWLENFENNNGNQDHSTSLGRILDNAFDISPFGVQRAYLNQFIEDHFETLARIDTAALISLISRHEPSLNSRQIDIKDPAVFLAYFDRYKCLHDIHGVQLANLPSIIVHHITVLCEKKPESVYPTVKECFNIIANDTQVLDQLEHLLVVHKDFDTLSIIRVYKHKFEEAVTELECSVRRHAEEVLTAPSSTSFARALRSLELAMAICEMEETFTAPYGLMESNEKLWLILIETCVRLANEALQTLASQQKANSVADFWNKCTHDCFKRISTAKLKSNDIPDKETYERSFLAIFNTFLHNSAASRNPATLSNIRNILHEVFVSYSYERELLTISLKMLESSVLRDMQTLALDTLKAWNVKSKLCTACSKPMWGPELASAHFDAWVDRLMRSVHLCPSVSRPYIAEPNDISTHSHLEFLIFKCSHGYHSKCLKSLTANSSTQCILCTHL